MLYLVYAVLSVNSWLWHGEIDSDYLTSCSEVMVELRTTRREMRWDGANHHEKLWLREVCMHVKLPSQIQQVRVLNRRGNLLIQGLPNLIRQVVPLISHIYLYPPHCSYRHQPSLSFLSITLPSSQITNVSHPSRSLHVMILSWHRVQHTPSTAYTQYSIHQVQHTPSTAVTQGSLSSLHSDDWKLTSECSFVIRRVFLHDRTASNPLSICGQR